ncbi:MAG: transglycosylase SLT domain-containing protein [Devosia sp.]
MGVAPITVPPGLALVLNSAGEKSNVDFDYLLQTAMRESSLDPEAKAKSSSAVGLFQFLESTWLQVMKEEGPRLGYQDYADQITRDADGDYAIKNKTKRAEILKLREDPQLAADLAAAFTQSNGAYLEQKFGRMPSAGELYIAHFLGPQGAEKLFAAGLKDPDQTAADLFPRQAKANRQIFYSGDHARTIKEVYRALVAKHLGAPAADPGFVTQQLAASAPVAPAIDPLEGKFHWPVEARLAQPTDAEPGFNTLFLATNPPAPPLTAATEALDSLVGAEQAPKLMGYVPLPAPLPLTPPVEGVAVHEERAPELMGYVPLPAPMPLTPPPERVAVLAEHAPELMGYVLLPAPIQLLPPDEAAVLAAQPPAPVDDIPKPRVLMSRFPASDGNAFLAQIYGN